MKNIETILSEAGVELTDEQKKAVVDAVAENYKTVADWQKQHDKVQNLEEQLATTKEALAKFDGIDAEGMKAQIAQLTADMEKKDAEHAEQIAEIDFQDMLKSSIAQAKGKNAKAIMALLDLDTLRASKNQKEDIAKALEGLAAEEDSKMLFGETETVVGTGDPVGTVKKTGSQTDDAQLRAAMGLPPVKESK